MEYKYLDICFNHNCLALFATFLFLLLLLIFLSYSFSFRNSHTVGTNAKVVPFGLFPFTGKPVHGQAGPTLENALGPKQMP